MASAALSRRIEKAVGYPPLWEMSALQRREFHDALLDVDTFEDLTASPGPSKKTSGRGTALGLNVLNTSTR
jgi:hypothetical protein